MSAREAITALVSSDDFADMVDDGLRHELVEGVVTTMTPAGARHGQVAARLLVHLSLPVNARHLGDLFAAETGFVLHRAPDTVRAPDVAFVRAGRLPEEAPSGFPDLAPDLVAEVVSPSDRSADVLAKALAWLDAGVLMVWIVDPQTRTVTVHRREGARVLRGDDELSGEDVVPGFALALSALW